MANKDEVLLTVSDLQKWREDDRQIGDQIAELEQKRAVVRRKLEAAEVFVGSTPDVTPEIVTPKPNGHDPDDPAETPPNALVANLRKTGDSLRAPGIKQRLIELGFGELLQAKPNYHYDLAYRLTHSKPPKLIKRGSKYRAAPISSPEGETEAVGASVRH